MRRKKKQKKSFLKYIFPLIFILILAITVFSLFSHKNFFSKADVQNYGRYTAQNGLIYKDNSPIVLHGVNWYGFETYDHVIHGLWYHNWKDIIQNVKSLGFNAIRVPFCPDSLKNTSVNTPEYALNPELKNLKSLDVLDTFLNKLNDEHIYFVLDHHVPDCDAVHIPDLWYTDSYSESMWIQDLQFVALRYNSLEYFVGIDLKNEPHGKATWGTGDVLTDWNTAVEKAGEAIHAINKDILIFVEGIGENPVCSSKSTHIIGENLEPENCYPISPQKIPQNKIVFSPHIYGPYVTNNYPEYFNDPSFPNNMAAIWDNHFGYLLDKGYTVIPGEWGSWYESYNHVTNLDKKDKVWMNELISYFEKRHICSSFYWALNPESTGTGGVLEFNWQYAVTDKMKTISDYFNYCRSTSTNITPTPTARTKPFEEHRTWSSGCIKRPNVKAPAGYYWETDCSGTCANAKGEPDSSLCPQNTSSGYVYPGTSNWCYNFSYPQNDQSQFHCLMLHYSRGDKAPSEKTSQAGSSCVENKTICDCDGRSAAKNPGHCDVCNGGWCKGGICATCKGS